MCYGNIIRLFVSQQKEIPTSSASIGLSEEVSQSTEIIDFSYNLLIKLSRSISFNIFL